MRPEKPIVRFLIRFGLMAIVAISSFGFFLLNPSRDPDTPAPPERDRVTVIALYPSIGTIRDLMTLRENKLINIPNLEVVGVYHEKEKTDYEKSKAFAAQNELDWITFSPVSAPLPEETVYKKNACTPDFEKLFKRAAGIIFFGGPDIPASLYQEKTSLLTTIEDPYRHLLEVSFAFHLLGGHQDESFEGFLDRHPDLPVLGICLGCQTLNVGAGGTLTQDIWSEVYGVRTLEDVIALGPSHWHSNPYARLFPHRDYSGFAFHEIQFAKEGRFPHDIRWKQEDRPLVFSSHHQQVEKLGKGFRVIASSLDGKVVEVIEHEHYRHVLGVQFHPEAWVLYDPSFRTRFTPDDKEPVNPSSYLQNHAPSGKFHRQFWSWVSRSWLEEHRKK